MSISKRWVQRPVNKDIVKQLQIDLGIHEVLCELLVSRNIHTYDQAKAFFRYELSQLHDPFLMKDMEKAVTRITKAIRDKEKILLYGDYDVDGTTSVTMMHEFLKQFHADIDYYIPDRYKEGYGISLQGIEYAKFNKIDLIIAMDCGIRAIEKADLAYTYDIDLIICDHHLPDEQLPKAKAILNPKQKDCSYPFDGLSGCGVSFKLAHAYCLEQKLDLPKYLFHLLDLVAISSACDLVPMVGENRILTEYGLQQLNHSPRLGILQMLKANDVSPPLTNSDLVFRIGPMINAAGRLADAKDAVKLLVTENDSQSLDLAKQLTAQNKRRQTIDKEIAQEAIALHEMECETENNPCVVQYQNSWHKGVIGIAASRVVERFCKPTIIMTESNGYYVGSARSVKDFNVYESLKACSHLLENFGGHKYAAGMTLHPDNFKEFKRTFTESVAARIRPEQLVHEIEVDAMLEPSEVTDSFYRILDQMGPHGPKNRAPVFIARNLKLRNVRLLKGEHLKATYSSKGQSMDVIGFFMKDYYEACLNSNVDICYVIDVNVWKGKRVLQLRLKDIRQKDEA